MATDWYKNAIIYSLDVETYMDANEDGIGDLKGLRHRLSYLSSIGVTCIWILPFYKSPNRDNGYDVQDYYQVDPRLGDLGHFAELVDEAEEQGIRIIVDLVVNHTSDQHCWFQEARKNKDSKFWDYYIWTDKKPEHEEQEPIFGKAQGNSVWAYDEAAGAYYYHTFYKHQPDLNISNPAVQEEIMRIMHFWLKLGVSGFRIDAAPHMVTEKGDEKFEGDPHDVFRKFRRYVEDQKKDAVLLAEVDVEPEKYENFFDDGEQMHMLLNFYINNFIFLSLARKKATPLVEAFKNLPKNTPSEQFANFLRNHDELDLERLSDKERHEVYEVFAPEENMKIYGRGIRRRLAPMLNNDQKKLRFAYSLLLTLPGTPILRYGQEIGMGEDLSIKGRGSVRTLMQWTSQKNGGFSEASEDKLVRPILKEGPYGYEKNNVNDQHKKEGSFLNWLIRAINLRKESPEFGHGEWETIEVENEAVLALCTKSKRGVGLTLHNFSEEEVKVKVKVEDSGNLAEFFQNKDYDDSELEKMEFTLSPYGYRWFRKRKILL